MSAIPDCRTDEYYNQKYLTQRDKDFIAGYDYAVDQILNLIEYNTDIFPELHDLLDFHKAVACVDKVKIVKEAIEDYAEMQRDEQITAFIDTMDEDEYKSIKERVDATENRRGEGLD